MFCVYFPELRLKTQRSCKQQVMTVAFFGLVVSTVQLGVVPSNLSKPLGQCDLLCCSLPLLWVVVGTTEQRQLKYSFMSLAHLPKFSVISTLIVVGSSYFPKSYCSIPIIFKAESLTSFFTQGSWYKDFYWFQLSGQDLPSVYPDSCETILYRLKYPPGEHELRFCLVSSWLQCCVSQVR